MAQHAFEMIGEASKLLLERGFTTECLTEALGRVGRAMRVDRVYIFENGRDANAALVANQRYEWTAASATAQLDNPELQNVPYSDVMPDWLVAFSTGDPVVGLVKDMPSPSKELLESQQVLSLLVCPISLGNDWWGFVGFDDCQSERQWPAEEVAVLETLARALSGSLRHAQMKNTLNLARLHLETVIQKCSTTR